MARINESGPSRAMHLEKVIKAPNAIIGELFYDLSKKRHIDNEREKIPRSLQYPEKLIADAQFRPGNDVMKNYVTMYMGQRKEPNTTMLAKCARPKGQCCI